MNTSVFIGSLLITAATSLSLSSDQKISKAYNFDAEVVMEMREYNGETMKTDSDLKFYSSGNHEDIGYIMDITTHGQSMSAQIIKDTEANTLTTLINQGGMKMGMQYDLAKMIDLPGSDQASSEDAEIKKTGKTKTILGHTCYEYEIIGDDSYSIAWMAEDLDMSSFFDTFSQMKGMDKNFKTPMPKGFPMEITSWPNGKGTDRKFLIEVTAINIDKSTSMSTEGYNIMKLN